MAIHLSVEVHKVSGPSPNQIVLDLSMHPANISLDAELHIRYETGRISH